MIRSLSGKGGTSGAAIDAASNGDDIVVAPGTYPLAATIDFKGKAITLRSASGDPADTILDGQDIVFHVVQCISGEGPETILSGFTITGGYANDFRNLRGRGEFLPEPFIKQYQFQM